MSTVGSVTRTSIKGQAEFTVPEIVSYLEDRMERALIALAVGADGSTVGRWRAGTVQPVHAREARLRNLHTVFTLIEQSDDAHVARAWLMGMSPQLEDRCPLDALREDDARSVMAAARAFVAGA